MENSKKITIQIPSGLLKKAMLASGKGITPTVRQGLELVAAGKNYDQLLALKGKVNFSLNYQDLRED